MRLLPLATALLVSGTVARAEDVTVFAAASLTTALSEIAEGWEAETGNTVALSFAGSSVLARQIDRGAPADVFVSASTEWMDYLEENGRLRDGTRRDLLGNALVLVGGTDAEALDPADLPAALGEGRLAMALVDSVPAGIYGREALTALGLWDALAPRVAQSDNVRAALALVATGEAPYGVVYATDAVAEPGVAIVATFPADSHSPIVYPAAITADAASPVAAQDFLDRLDSDAARAVFEGQGFTIR